MNKLYVIPLVLLFCALVVIGCGAPATTPVPAPSSAPAAAPKPAAPAPSPSVAPAPTSKPAPAPSTTSAAAAKPAAPQYGGTLRVIEAGGPGTGIGWPPEIAGGSGVTSQICLDQLLHEDRLGNITPALAASYEVVTDPKNPSITFKLRKGVKFHDGTDFNAQAVKWNIDNIKTGVNPSTTAVWKSWEVLDDYTFRVYFTQWRNINIRNFTGIGALFCSPTAYQTKGVDWVRWNMVGTGAFKQVEFAKDVRLRTVRYDDYWDTGKPYLFGLNMEYVPDSLTRLALFKSGGGDVMAANAKDASDLKGAGYTVLSYLGGANVLIPDSVNADSPWSNPKVRMAAEYAIDKEAMSKALGYGFEPAAYQIAPLGSKAYVSSITGRKYDPAKAKQLLTEAGFPNGFKTKIIRDGSLDRNAAVAVQSYLAAIGIQTDIDFVEAARLAAVTTGTWNNGLLFHQTRPFPNFNAVLSTEFGFPTSTFYKSLKKPDGWGDIYNATMQSVAADPALMQKAVQAFYDDCTLIPITYYSSIWVTQPNVHDTGRGEMGSSTQFTPWNAWLSK